MSKIFGRSIQYSRGGWMDHPLYWMNHSAIYSKHYQQTARKQLNRMKRDRSGNNEIIYSELQTWFSCELIFKPMVRSVLPGPFSTTLHV